MLHACQTLTVYNLPGVKKHRRSENDKVLSSALVMKNHCSHRLQQEAHQALSTICYFFYRILKSPAVANVAWPPVTTRTASQSVDARRRQPTRLQRPSPRTSGTRTIGQRTNRTARRKKDAGAGLQSLPRPVRTHLPRGRGGERRQFLHQRTRRRRRKRRGGRRKQQQRMRRKRMTGAVKIWS